MAKKSSKPISKPENTVDQHLKLEEAANDLLDQACVLIRKFALRATEISRDSTQYSKGHYEGQSDLVIAAIKAMRLG